MSYKSAGTILLCLLASSSAACGGPSDAWESGFANRLCPVQGGEVDTDNPALVIFHDGQKIGFCCAGCPEAFRADPDSYMRILRSEAEIYGYRQPGA